MTIDIHSHIYPETYLQALKARETPPRVHSAGGQRRLVLYPDQEAQPHPNAALVTPKFTTIEEKLRDQDSSGIQTSIISLGNPWFDFLPAEGPFDLVSRTNDEMAAACAAHPGRLRFLAAIPTSSIQAAILELVRVARVPSVAGFIIGTRFGNTWLDDDLVMPFWEQAGNLGLPVFLHPHYGIGGEDMRSHGHNFRTSLGYPYETGVAAARLLYSGILGLFPDLRIILAHAGGALPYLLGRLEAYGGPIGGNQTDAISLVDQFRRFYFDTITYSPAALKLLIELAGCERLLFGTDHPYSARDACHLRDQLHLSGLDQTQIQQVLVENARRLFNLP